MRGLPSRMYEPAMCKCSEVGRARIVLATHDRGIIEPGPFDSLDVREDGLGIVK